MPVPPPKPSTETTNRRVQREMRQIKRALQAEGAMELDALRTAVGGAYWDKERFDKALVFALDSGNVVKDQEGKYAAT
jgi:hypothetical protein